MREMFIVIGIISLLFSRSLSIEKRKNDLDGKSFWKTVQKGLVTILPTFDKGNASSERIDKNELSKENPASLSSDAVPAVKASSIGDISTKDTKITNQGKDDVIVTKNFDNQTSQNNVSFGENDDSGTRVDIETSTVAPSVNASLINKNSTSDTKSTNQDQNEPFGTKSFENETSKITTSSGEDDDPETKTGIEEITESANSTFGSTNIGLTGPPPGTGADIEETKSMTSTLASTNAGSTNSPSEARTDNVETNSTTSTLGSTNIGLTGPPTGTRTDIEEAQSTTSTLARTNVGSTNSPSGTRTDIVETKSITSTLASTNVGSTNPPPVTRTDIVETNSTTSILSSTNVGSTNPPTSFENAPSPSNRPQRSTGEDWCLAIFRFFQQLSPLLSKDNGNFVTSPLSIHATLDLVQKGAAGKTKAEIDRQLGFQETSPGVFDDTVFEEQKKEWTNRYVCSNGTCNGTYLQIATSLFLSKTISLREKSTENVRFLENDIKHVDFSNPTSASKIINKWAAKETGGNIKSIVSPGTIDSSVKLIATNVVYFKGLWKNKFLKEKTKPETFFSEDGEVVVDMMHQTGNFNLFVQKDYKFNIVLLPYSGNQFAMGLLKPSEGITSREILETMKIKGPKVFCNLEEDSILFRDAEIDLKIPKFVMESSLNLAKYLKIMGMKEMFDKNNALFSNISDRKMYVSDVVHMAKIEVTEDGSEASASTKVSLSENRMSGGGPEPFYLNEPFIFTIFDQEAKIPLFLGHVVNPKAGAEEIFAVSKDPKSDISGNGNEKKSNILEASKNSSHLSTSNSDYNSDNEDKKNRDRSNKSSTRLGEKKTSDEDVHHDETEEVTIDDEDEEEYKNEDAKRRLNTKKDKMTKELLSSSTDDSQEAIVTEESGSEEKGKSIEEIIDEDKTDLSQEKTNENTNITAFCEMVEKKHEQFKAMKYICLMTTNKGLITFCRSTITVCDTDRKVLKYVANICKEYSNLCLRLAEVQAECSQVKHNETWFPVPQSDFCQTNNGSSKKKEVLKLNNQDDRKGADITITTVYSPSEINTGDHVNRNIEDRSHDEMRIHDKSSLNAWCGSDHPYIRKLEGEVQVCKDSARKRVEKICSDLKASCKLYYQDLCLEYEQKCEILKAHSKMCKFIIMPLFNSFARACVDEERSQTFWDTFNDKLELFLTNITPSMQND